MITDYFYSYLMTASPNYYIVIYLFLKYLFALHLSFLLIGFYKILNPLIM